MMNSVGMVVGNRGTASAWWGGVVHVGILDLLSGDPEEKRKEHGASR